MRPRKTRPARAYLTPPEIAAETGSRPETVISWIRSGELPAVDFARRGATRPRFRVNRADYETFLAGRAVQSPAPRRPGRRQADPGVTEYV